jgi:SAM-dependent methyltransferase
LTQRGGVPYLGRVERGRAERAMSGEAARFVGSIPEEYNRGLGPVIFADYAADLARRAAGAAPSRVLETAAGTGIATRLLRDALPAGAALTASDLNPPMLDLARTKFRAGEAVEFRPADATRLPFADDAFDAVVCQFGVMFYPDKPQSYREARRVLAPGGRYYFNVWDSHRHNPFARIAHETAGRFFAADPPQFYRVPFGYHAIDPIKEALLETGFGGLSFEVVGIEKTIPDATAFARGLIFGNPMIDEIRARGGVDPEAVVDALAEALRREFGPDPGRMPLQAIVVEARRA